MPWRHVLVVPHWTMDHTWRHNPWESATFAKNPKESLQVAPSNAISIVTGKPPGNDLINSHLIQLILLGCNARLWINCGSAACHGSGWFQTELSFRWVIGSLLIRTIMTMRIVSNFTTRWRYSNHFLRNPDVISENSNWYYFGPLNRPFISCVYYRSMSLWTRVASTGVSSWIFFLILLTSIHSKNAIADAMDCIQQRRIVFRRGHMTGKRTKANRLQHHVDLPLGPILQDAQRCLRMLENARECSGCIWDLWWRIANIRRWMCGGTLADVISIHVTIIND